MTFKSLAIKGETFGLFPLDLVIPLEPLKDGWNGHHFFIPVGGLVYG